MRLTIYSIAIICFGISSCAGEPTIEELEEREWRQQIDRENWAMCESMLYQHGVMIIHVDHQVHNKRRKLRYWDLRSDLRENQCRYRMGKHYIRY